MPTCTHYEAETGSVLFPGFGSAFAGAIASVVLSFATCDLVVNTVENSRASKYGRGHWLATNQHETDMKLYGHLYK